MPEEIVNGENKEETRKAVTKWLLAFVAIALIAAGIFWYASQHAGRTVLTPAEIQARLNALVGTSTPPTPAEIQKRLNTLTASTTSPTPAEIQQRLKSLQ